MPPGQPRLAIGAHGKIAVTEQAPGRFVARCRMRMSDGVTRTVERSGTAKTKASKALAKRLGELERGVGANGITPDASVELLLTRWMAHRRGAQDISAQSLDDYWRCIVATIVPLIGQMRVGEMTSGIADTQVLNVAAVTPARARQMRTILRQSFAMAVRHGAIRTNPIHDLTKLSLRRKKVTVSLTPRQRALVRRAIATWEAGDARRSRDVGRILDVQLATGARIGEILALRWSDVDLSTTPATVAITGTEVFNSLDGHHRQAHTKGGKVGRRVAVPSWATAILLSQRIDAGASEFVFPSRAGTIRSQHNVRTSLRAALLGTAVQGLTPHVMRSTVATTLKDDLGIEAAAGQLDHSSARVTQRYYIEAAETAPDMSDALEQLGPQTAPLGEGS